jgi:uncharacterized protein (TIGR02594 family)
MRIAIIDPTELLKEPRADADFIAEVGPFESIKSVEKLGENEDKSWFDVEVKFGLSKKRGWVRAECTGPADAKDAVPVRPWVFLKNCTLAARVINAAHREKPDADPAYGVNRDYLLAWAWLATKHPEEETDELFWSFNLRKDDEWGAYVANTHFNTSGYTADDFGDPVLDATYQIAQCYGAAYVAYRDHMALSKAVTETLAPDTASGPYIPNSVELLLAHVAGIKVAAALAGIDRATKVSDSLSAHNVSAEVAEKIRSFLGLAEGATPTIADAVKTVEAKLDDAFQKTRDLLLKYTPEDVAVIAPSSTSPPWMKVAREEEAKGIAESNPATVPRIIEYFKATGFETSKVAAWCGAFVAWCLSNCGDESAARSVKKATAARAASWASWGTITLPQRSDEIPEGAVVTLSPSEPGDSSGHVGFFVRRSAGTITLLGGNQSDRIKESTYADSRIVAIRWINWNGGEKAVEDDEEPEVADVPASGGQPGTPETPVLGPLTAKDWEKYKEVLGKRESANKYHAVNQIGFCGRWQLGAPALIDLGYVRKGTSTRRLRVAGWIGKDGITARAEFLANKDGVQDRAILAYTTMNYKRLLKLGALTHSDSRARVAGVLAAAHLTGPGGARLLVKAKVSAKDGNGVPSSAYFALLSQAFGGSAKV